MVWILSKTDVYISTVPHGILNLNLSTFYLHHIGMSNKHYKSRAESFVLDILNMLSK